MARLARDRPIRFGLQVSPPLEGGPGEVERIGREAEAAGFDVISVSDHVGPSGPAPMIVLAGLAGATSVIGLATMVLNCDLRNPVQLAWEAASLQLLSGGRFELGLGAGHTPQEYAATGIELDHPITRKRRLAESVEIIGALLAGERVDHHGEHHRIEGAEVPPLDRAPPILVGGNGTALLSHAAGHADAIGLQGLGRTRPDGHRHEVRWGIERLEAQLAIIADAAGDRHPELAALVQVVTVTDDRERELAAIVDRAEGLTMEHAAATPYLAVGTEEEIARGFVAARDRWGISYFTVRDPDLAPVIARVRELEAGSA